MEEESQYQCAVAQAGYEQQRECLVAEARAALTDQAASSDQKLGVLSQENQQQISLLRQEADQQRIHVQGQMAAVQQENFYIEMIPEACEQRAGFLEVSAQSRARSMAIFPGNGC